MLKTYGKWSLQAFSPPPPQKNFFLHFLNASLSYRDREAAKLDQIFKRGQTSTKIKLLTKKEIKNMLSYETTRKLKYGQKEKCFQSKNSDKNPVLLKECSGSVDVEIIYSCFSNGYKCPHVKQEFKDDIRFNIVDRSLGNFKLKYIRSKGFMVERAQGLNMVNV